MSSTESQELLSNIENIIVKNLENVVVKHIDNSIVKNLENIVVKHLENIVVKHLEDFKQQVNNRLDKIEEQIKVIPGMQSNIEQMQSDIKKLQDNYKELYKETRNISRTVAKIEVEHGEKLAVLFDALTGNTEKQEILENRLKKCEKRIDINEDQIYFLNSKSENL